MEEGGNGSSGAKGMEAPDLADLVAAGDLSAVEERLPGEPVVIDPVDRIGAYGGVWNSAMLGPEDDPWLARTVGYDPPLRWDPDLVEVLPNIVEDFEVSPDAKQYTYQLRPGMRWSDGTPFTAEDIVFAQNEVLSNDELYPEQSNPTTAEALDEYTVRITLELPDGLYLRNAAGGTSSLFTMPRHYLEQFHKDHNRDIESLVAEAGAPDWVDFFLAKSDMWGNADLPRLHAWLPVSGLGEDARMVFERNPYYWKVDPDGSQLPYIDRVVFTVHNTPESMLLAATNGELDMHARHFNSPENKPVLAEHREGSGYQFFDQVPSNMNNNLLVLNLTVEDPVKREMFRNKQFRIGLSHAINREELVEAVWQRQGEPWQAAPRAEATLFDEEFAKQYTEYDVDLANDYLDQAGYSERDSQGRRLDPDGRPISIDFEFAEETHPAATLELIVEYWREVGITLRLQTQSRELFLERNMANEQEMLTWGGDGGLAPIEISDWYFPQPSYLEWAPLWSEWYESGGTAGEEPIEPIKRQMELYDEIKGTPDPDEQEQLMRQILNIAKEEFWIIGTVLRAPEYGIVKNNFHNVPQHQMQERHSTPGVTHPEQYFFEEEI